MHHVATQNFYADIGIALCDALYDVRRAAPYLALPKEFLLPEIVHRRAVVDHSRAIKPELVGDVLRHGITASGSHREKSAASPEALYSLKIPGKYPLIVSQKRPVKICH